MEAVRGWVWIFSGIAHYHKKYWPSKIEIVCDIGFVALVCTGTIGSITLNPIILGTI